MAKKGTLTVRIIGDTKKFEKALSGVGGKLTKFAGLAAKAGAVAAAGFGVIAVRSFANFDQKMTQSLAIMGDVSDAMRKDMSEAAREVAKTTTFSADQAAESYFFLASAGMDAEASIAALPQVAAFAQAGMFDMATATDLATDAQSSLGLASDDAEENLKNLTRVTDVFVKANTLANTSVEQISEAMTNKAGAAMRAVGMEIEEGSAVLAAFADQGVKGSEAGTQFAIVLRDLQTKALDNKDAFEEAGVAVFDADGEMRNMADIVGDLEGKLEGMSDAQKKAALSALGFSDKSMGALQTLLGTSDAIREYQGELEKAGGITEEVADKQLETFNAKMGLLKDRFMDFAISAGSVIVPKLLAAFDHIEAWWEKHGPQVMATIKRLGKAFRDFVEREVVPRFVRLKDSIAENSDRIRGIFGNVGRVVSSVARTFARAFQDMVGDTSMSTITIEGVIDTLVGVLETVSDAVADVVEFVERNWPKIQAAITPALMALGGDFTGFERVVKGVFARIGIYVAQKMAGILNAVIETVNKALAHAARVSIPGVGPLVSENLPQIPTVDVPSMPSSSSSSFSGSSGPGGRTKHSGGLVTAGLPKTPGARQDERDVRLQVGERVVSRRDVASAAAAGAGGGVLHVHFDGPVAGERELLSFIQRGIREFKRRNGGSGF